MSQPLADTFLRGISRPNSVLSDGFVTLDAFEDDSRTVKERESRGAIPIGSEVSINWEDGEAALTLLMSAPRGSAGGVARVRLATVQAIFASEKFANWVHFERDPLPDKWRPNDPQNAFHGNIVFGSNIENARKRAIQTFLAANATHVPRPQANRP